MITLCGNSELNARLGDRWIGTNGDVVDFVGDVYMGGNFTLDAIRINGNRPQHGDISPDWLLPLARKVIRPPVGVTIIRDGVEYIAK